MSMIFCSNNRPSLFSSVIPLMNPLSNKSNFTQKFLGCAKKEYYYGIRNTEISKIGSALRRRKDFWEMHP